MTLELVVQLYRLLQCPALKNGEFRGCLKAGVEPAFNEACILINKIRKADSGRFIDLVADDDDVIDSELLSSETQKVEFTYRLPINSVSTFHNNLAALLECDPTIMQGQMPNDFYLVDSDYYHTGTFNEDTPDKIKNLELVTKLIKSLSQLASYVNKDNSSHKLLFLLPTSEAQPAMVELLTQFSCEDIESLSQLEIKLVDNLLRNDAQHDVHHIEKIGLFSSTLARFISNFPVQQAFSMLLYQWDKFLNTYKQDLATYISGFAFHKARKQIAEAELEIAERLSIVMSGILGKVLSLPLTMVAVVAMTKTSSLIEQLLLLSGVFITSILLIGAIVNQQALLARTKHAKAIMLQAIEGQQEQFPEDLRNDYQQMSEQLMKDEQRVGRWLWFFLALSLVPFITSTSVLIWQYRAVLKQFLITCYNLC